MRCWFYFIACLLVTICNYSFGQSERSNWNNEDLPDSTRLNNLRSYYEPLRDVNIDSFYFYAKLDLAIAQKLSSQVYQAKALSNLGIYYGITQNFDSSEVYFDKALVIYSLFNDSLRIADNLLSLSNINVSRREVSKAIEYAEKALVFYKSKDNQLGIANIYGTLGNLNYIINNNVEAEKFYLRAVKIYEKLNKKRRLAHTYSNLAPIYREDKKYEEALMYNSLALKILEENFKEEQAMGFAYQNRGTTYFYLDSIEQSNKNYKKAVQAFLAEGVLGSYLSNTYARLGINYLEIDMDTANLYARNSFDLISKNKDILTNELPYRLQYRLNKKKGDFEKALFYLEQISLIQDTLNQRKEASSIESTNARIEYNQRLSEEKLKMVVLASRIEERELRKQLIFGLMAILIFIVTLFILWKRELVNKSNRALLLNEIKLLKTKVNSSERSALKENVNNKLNLIRINEAAEGKLNETDTKILEVLFANPDYLNKQIGEVIFMSADGVNSSLKKMYRLFEIEGRANKRVSLVMKVFKISAQTNG